jgi:serine/threonine protein phosphatase PrpC
LSSNPSSLKGTSSSTALDDILNDLSNVAGKGGANKSLTTSSKKEEGGGGGHGNNINSSQISKIKSSSSSSYSSSSSPKIDNLNGGGGELLVYGDDIELNPLSKEQEALWEERKVYSRLLSSFGRTPLDKTSSSSSSSIWTPAPKPTDILALYEARDAEEAASEERAGGRTGDGPRGLLALRSTKDRGKRRKKPSNNGNDDDDSFSESSSSSSSSNSSDSDSDDEVDVLEDEDEDVAVVLDDGLSLDQGLGLLPSSITTSVDNTGMNKQQKKTTKKKAKNAQADNKKNKNSVKNRLLLDPEEEPSSDPPQGWDAHILGDRFVSCPAGSSGQLGLVFGTAEARGKRATMEDRAVCIPSLNRTLKATAPLMGAVTPSIVAEKHTPEYAFFAVYDGHSGSSTSETLSQAFHFRLAAGLGLVKATENDPDPTLHLPGGEASRPLSSSSSSSSPSSTASIAFSVSGEGATIADRLALIEKDVLINAALDFDLELQEDLKPGDPISGSTAIIALIRRSSSSSSSSSPSTISSTINDGSSNTTSPVVLTIGNVGDSRAVLSAPA